MSDKIRFSDVTDYEPIHELSKMGINFVSLCGAGIHPGAQVELFKAECRGYKGDGTTCEDCGKNRKSHQKSMAKATDETTGASGGATRQPSKEQSMPDLTKVALPDDTPDEVRKYVESLEATVFKSDEGEDPLAKADPAVRELVLKAQRDAEEAQRVAKAERELRERNEALAKAETLTGLGIETDKVADALIKLRGADPELAKSIEEMLDSANIAVEKSAMFTEFGSHGGSVTMPKVEALVADLRKADPELTKEQAEARVYRNHPELYAEYQASKEG